MKRKNGVGHVPNEKHILICAAESTLAGGRVSSQMLRDLIDERKTDERPHGHSIGEATVRRLARGLIKQDLLEFEWGLVGPTNVYDEQPKSVRYYSSTQSGIALATSYYLIDLGIEQQPLSLEHVDVDLLIQSNLGREALKQIL